MVDFISFEKKLIVEVDGGQHNEMQISVQDDIRTKWLAKEGFRLIRFWNNDVLQNLEGVLAQIDEALK